MATQTAAGTIAHLPDLVEEAGQCFEGEVTDRDGFVTLPAQELLERIEDPDHRFLASALPGLPDALAQEFILRIPAK